MPTLTVMNSNDSGAGSLRATIASAGQGDTITFAPGLGGSVIRLTSGSLSINVSLTIDGDINNDGRPDVTISGDTNGDDLHIAGSASITDAVQSDAAGKLADNVRVIAASAAITIDGLVITGGSSDYGGGIFAASTLAMTHSVVAGNKASVSGGGIDVLGASSTVSDSTVSGNLAQNAGGFLSQASATLTNVTVVGNTATSNYGGLTSNGALTLVNSTVTGNKAALVGGVSTPGGTMTLTNSIVLGNSAPTVDEVGSNTPIVYSGVNIVGLGNDINAADGVINASSLDSVFASVGANPFTGVISGLLTDNGGFVPTVALRAYSGNPAIDRADAGLSPSTDGRGFARYDVPGYAGSADLGAYEAQNVGMPSNTLLPFLVIFEDSTAFLGSTSRVAQPNGLALTVTLSVGHGIVQLTSLNNLTVTGGANGTGTISVQGSIADINTALSSLLYKPTADYNGHDTLTMTTTDGNVSDVDSTSITINGVNDAPILAAAIADQSTPEDAAWTFQLPAGTFTDVDNASLTYTASLGDGSSLPAWLTFTAGTRTFSGTPPQDFNGTLDLKVTASDGSLTASDSFTLTVTPVNDAPTTSLVTLLPAASEDGSRVITVAELLAKASDVDLDALTVSGLGASSGALVDNGNGTWSFTPVPNDDTAVSFTYTVEDGHGGSAAGTAILDLLPVNDAPMAADDTVAAVEGETPVGNVLTNDSDIDVGDSLAVIGILGGTVGQELVGKYGNLTLQADGSYSYAAQNTTLPEGAHASETFTYTISDGHGGTATADLVVNVTGGNPPFGNNAPNVRGTIPASFVSEGTGDLDGNGTLDFLWRDSGTNAVELWTTAANGAITTKSLGTVGANWSFAAVGDLNGDGTDDVVFHDGGTGAAGAWIMRNGGTPSDWRALGTLGPTVEIAGVGDFDHNGTDDLLLFDSATRVVEVWQQGATAAGSRSTLATLPADWQIAGIGDLDADGTDDVLLFNSATREVGAWHMSNGKLGGWNDLGPLKADWEITEIGNFNGKGPEDIGFYNATNGQDGAWVMSPGQVGDWLAEPAHDDLDPIGAGRFASASADQILWHNPITGAVVTF